MEVYSEASSRVINIISRHATALWSSVLSTEALRSLTADLDSCMGALPDEYQIGKASYLHPSLLAPFIVLQNARLLLYRQNMTPRAPLQLRENAIRCCSEIAQETSQVIARCMQDPLGHPSKHQPDSWHSDLKNAASALLCTHLWRCTLFLAFKANFQAALLCAHASAALGSVRTVNSACGRYLEFFLHDLDVEIRASQRFEPIDDEELIAYVSGDLQGSATRAWIWQKSPMDFPANDKLMLVSAASPTKEHVAPRPSHEVQEDTSSWNGWDGILSTLRQLSREPHSLHKQESSVYSTGRISIADIM